MTSTAPALQYLTSEQGACVVSPAILRYSDASSSSPRQAGAWGLWGDCCGSLCRDTCHIILSHFADLDSAGHMM